MCLSYDEPYFYCLRSTIIPIFVLRTRENNDENKMTRTINLIWHSEAYVNIYIHIVLKNVINVERAKLVLSRVLFL